MITRRKSRGPDRPRSRRCVSAAVPARYVSAIERLSAPGSANIGRLRNGALRHKRTGHETTGRYRQSALTNSLPPQIFCALKAASVRLVAPILAMMYRT